MTSNMHRVARRLKIDLHRGRSSALEFEDLLRLSAYQVGAFALLGPILRQLDDLPSLHITTMRLDYLAWLQQFDQDYRLSNMA